MTCPVFDEHERKNGAFAVQEMSPRAQEGAASVPGLTVYEYQASDISRTLPTSYRYAIIWEDHWQCGLLKDECQFILERMWADHERKEMDQS